MADNHNQQIDNIIQQLETVRNELNNVEYFRQTYSSSVDQISIATKEKQIKDILTVIDQLLKPIAGEPIK